MIPFVLCGLCRVTFFSHNTHTTLTQHSHNTHTILTQHSHNTHTTLTQHSHNNTSSFGHHDHPWMSSIAVIPVRFNRFTMYDMRRLHNIYYADVDSSLLANNPEEGRLAINTFVYSGSADFQRCASKQVSPEGCLGCLSDPGCAWVVNGEVGLGGHWNDGKCYPVGHARRRYGRHIHQGMRESFKVCKDTRIYQMHGVDAKCVGRRCVPVGDTLVKDKYSKISD